eukprot:COSAG05_NODE_1219_length_5481_cov_29.388889_3_plen_145_part_00
MVFNPDSSPIHGTSDLGQSLVPGSARSVRSINVAPAMTQTHEPGRRSLASHGSDSRAHASQLHMEFQEDVSAMEDQMQRRRRMSLARTQARLANRRVAAEIDAETHATDSTDTKGDDGPESEPGPELEPQAQQSSALTPQKLPV